MVAAKMLCQGMIKLLTQHGDVIKPRAISSNVVENFFSRVRSKRRRFSVAEWAHMYQHAVVVTNQRAASSDDSGYTYRSNGNQNHRYFLFTTSIINFYYYFYQIIIIIINIIIIITDYW